MLLFLHLLWRKIRFPVELAIMYIFYLYRIIGIGKTLDLSFIFSPPPHRTWDFHTHTAFHQYNIIVILYWLVAIPPLYFYNFISTVPLLSLILKQVIVYTFPCYHFFGNKSSMLSAYHVPIVLSLHIPLGNFYKPVCFILYLHSIGTFITTNLTYPLKPCILLQ